ncbi:MAG: hypothetical protein FWD61_01880, partial [Phycisphaerales bacterium]|nr:hypothetical protein [Phycisphaerales bacterium]
RDDLVGKLFVAQDALRQQTEDATIKRNALEGELLALHASYEKLASAKKAAPIAAPTITVSEPPKAPQQNHSLHRDRLLKQAKALRLLRKETFEHQTLLLKGREHVAKERQQLRTRKENLEQVKQLLEQQEMVMARKLADHSALKTVAAVGIFMILTLVASFVGVYKFAKLGYQAEAIVQLYPPASMKGQELDAWLTRQSVTVKLDDVTFEAWKLLRSDGHYSMYDVRDSWLGSLARNLDVQVDSTDPRLPTLLIRYAGNDADGVAQVCNALAKAYVALPMVAQGTTIKPGTVAAPAIKPDLPCQDNRIAMSLGAAAGVMVVGLILVMLSRYVFRRRQRKERDQINETGYAEMNGHPA